MSYSSWSFMGRYMTRTVSSVSMSCVCVCVCVCVLQVHDSHRVKL
jgi:hypothetical protein